MRAEARGSTHTTKTSELKGAAADIAAWRAALAERFPDDTFFRADVARMRAYLELRIKQEGMTDAR